jgi:hypothetical protein
MFGEPADAVNGKIAARRADHQGDQRQCRIDQALRGEQSDRDGGGVFQDERREHDRHEHRRRAGREWHQGGGDGFDEHGMSRFGWRFRRLRAEEQPCAAAATGGGHGA